MDSSMKLTNSRESERKILDRCVAAGLGQLNAPSGAREANLFNLGGIVLRSSRPAHAARLIEVAERYLARHPSDRMSPEDLASMREIFDIPRFRNNLIKHLDSCQ